MLTRSPKYLVRSAYLVHSAYYLKMTNSAKTCCKVCYISEHNNVSIVNDGLLHYT